MRLHTDAAAADAAEREGARAFTAGRDVYLGRDAAAGVRADRGFRTLAHEIAHVLQQTGRPGGDGRLVVRDLPGSPHAGVQREDLVEYADKWKGYFHDAPLYKEIKKAYEKAGIDAEIKEVDKIYPFGFGAALDTDHDKLVVRTKTGATFDGLSNPAKAFYVDCLKAVGKVAEAAAIFKKLPDTTSTAFRSKDLYVELRKDLSWLGPLARSQSFTKLLYPWGVLDAFRHYFYGPVQVVVPPLPKYQERSFAETKRISEQTGLVDNELQLLTVLAMDRLVADQKAALEAFGDAPKAERPDEEKLRIAEAYATRGPDDKTIGAPATEPELRALYTDLWPSLKKLAEEARDTWKRIKRLNDAVYGGFVFETLTADEVKALAKEIGSNPRFSTLDDALVTVAAKLVNVDPTPDPKEYLKRVEGQREALRKHVAPYGAALISLARKTKRNKEDERMMLRLGLAIRHVLAVRESIARRYDHVLDVKLTDEGYADERLAARIRIANLLWFTGDMFGLPRVKAAADVFLAKDKPQLALLSPAWMLDTRPVGPMDFQGPETVSLEGTGLSNTLITRFFFTDYLSSLATALETALDPTKNPNLDLSASPGILNTVLKTVKAADRPQRYLMPKHEFWYDPKGAVKVEKGKVVPDPTKKFHSLVFRHPKTKKLTDSLPLEAKQYTSLSPPRPRDAPIVLWNVPRFDRVIKRLMEVKELDKQVQDYLDRKAKKGIRISIVGYEWMEWLDGLEGLARELREKKETEKISKVLVPALDVDYETAKQRFYRAARKATAAQIRPLLARYRDDERDNADVPDRVFALMEQLALATMIDADQPVQATLLVLELADDLSRSFGPKDMRWAHQVVGTLFRYTTGAVAVWNDPKRKEEVKKGKQPGTTDADLEQAAVKLEKLRDALGKSVLALQRRRGLLGRTTTGGSKPNTNGYLKTINLIPTLEAGKSFMMYLREWELVKVHVDFDFLPRFPDVESLGVRWPHPDASLAGDDLVIDASSGATKGTRLPADTTLLTLRRRTIPPRPKKGSKKPRGAPSPWEDVVITAGDVKTLTRLWHDFGDFSGLQYIIAAGEAIEAIVELELELAEFIPGVGQGIMVGRFIAAVAAFLASDEFAELTEAFREEGFKAFPNLIEKISELLKPSAARVFGWFFFGRPTMIEAPAHGTSRAQEQQKKAATGGVWAKLARVIRNVVHFAKRLLGTVEAVRNRAQAPFRTAQSYVLAHPGLAAIIALMIRHFDLLSSLVLDTLFEDPEEKKDTDFVGRLKASATEGVKGLAERISNAVNVIRELQLPEEIVPLDLVGEFVVDRVISSLGGKYKFIAKGGRFALQKIPGNPWGMIMEKIGKALTVVSGVDPNDTYRQYIRTHLQVAIDGLRTDLFSWLQAVFGDVKLFKELGIKIDFSPGAKTAIEFAGVEFHDGSETEPSPADSEHAPTSTGPLHTPSGGERLPPVTRARAEASLGHDLSHVRLHRGSEGEAVTGRMHADGITSGSHVYLHPTVSPSGGGHGERVLHHELGHVLQQTGARPLGRIHDDTPTAGRSGRGLTFDPAREAAADRLADRASSHTASSAPVDVGAPAEGPQPALDRDFVKEMLEKLRDPQRLKEEAVDVSAIAVLKAENLLREDDLNRPVAEKLPAKLVAAIKAMKPADFQPPFDTIAPKLTAVAASSENEEHIKKAVKVLVVSTRQRTSPRRTKTEAAPPAVLWLDPGRFAHELARYLYALTGFAFDLSFAVKDGPESIGKKPVIDLDAAAARSTIPKTAKPAMHVAPFALLRVGHVHLPFLGDSKAAHDLWELLATNSFSSEAGFSTDKELWIAATRLAVGHLLPKPGMYLQKKFELSALAKKSVRSQLKRIRPLIAHWPSPTDYAKPKSADVADKTDPIAAHTGLRVGTFGELDKEINDHGVTDRDPHHVPQVLLIDYFSNTHKLSPFPELLKSPFVADLYPGVSASSAGEVTDIGPIQIKPYTLGKRSDALPSILIAVHTHQAEIHVGTEPPDEKSKRKTMGGWVRRRFHDKLGGNLVKVMGHRDSLLELKAAAPTKDVTTKSGVTTSSKGLGDTIVAAARHTYGEMYKEMMNKLKRGLHEQEIPYYNLIAAAKKGSPLTEGEKLKKTQVDAAYSEFDTKKVRPIMKTSGFLT